MFETIMMMIKLTWRNWRWWWHVNTCCVSLGAIKIPSKGNWRFWNHFVSNLSDYTCAKISLVWQSYCKN